MGERIPYRLLILGLLLIAIGACVVSRGTEQHFSRSAGPVQPVTSQDSNLGVNTSHRESNAAGGDVVRDIEPIAAIWLGSVAIVCISVPFTLLVYLIGHRSKSVRTFFDFAKGKRLVCKEKKV